MYYKFKWFRERENEEALYTLSLNYTVYLLYCTVWYLIGRFTYDILSIISTLLYRS